MNRELINLLLPTYDAPSGGVSYLDPKYLMNNLKMSYDICGNSSFFGGTVKGVASFVKYLQGATYFYANSRFSIYEMKEEVYSTYFAYASDPMYAMFKMISDNRITEFSKEIISMLSSESFVTVFLEKVQFLRSETEPYSYLNFSSEEIVSAFGEFSYDGTEGGFAECYTAFIQGLTAVNTDYTVMYDKFPDEVPLDFMAGVYEDMSYEEKIQFIKANDKDISVIDLKAMDSFNKMFDSYFSEMTLMPESVFLNNALEKYNALLKDVRFNEASCDMLKTMLYVAIYLTKDVASGFPQDQMNTMLSRGSSWAIGGSDSTDPGFYGNSDVAKAFSTFYPFIEGEYNPYKEIINNSTHNEMDIDILKIHKFFYDNDLEDYVYRNMFEEKHLGEHSVMDTLCFVRDLFKIIEDPLIVTSGTNTILSYMTGIVSSIMNSAASIMDFTITGSMKQFFYKDIIPLNGKKYSVASMYNYLNFIKVILENYDEMETIDDIRMGDFINQAYETLGLQDGELQANGYGTWDDFLNNSGAISLYSNNFVKAPDGFQFTARRHCKLLYSAVMFAFQKRKNKFSHRDIEFEKNFGNSVWINNMVNSLDENELFFLFEKFNVDYWNFAESLGDFSEDRLFAFNELIPDLTFKYDHDDVSFYKSYEETGFETIVTNKQSTPFSEIPYILYLKKSMQLYFDYVDQNKDIIKQIVFSSNNIGDIDDFLPRFLPSLKVLCRAVGINAPNVKKITSIMDYILSFITNVMFRDVFLNVKSQIMDMIKQYSTNILGNTDQSSGDNFIINLGFGNNKVSKKIENVINVLSDSTYRLRYIKNCFKDPVYMSTFTNWEDAFDLDINDVEFNLGEEVEDFIQNTDIPTYDWEINIKDKIDEVYYKDEVIYGKTSDGSYIIIVDKNDSYNDGKTIFTPGDDKVSVNFDDSDTIKHKITVDKDSFEKLAEIRDFIKNSTNATISKTIGEIKKVESKIDKELSKKKPSITTIRNLETLKRELTEKLESVKNNENIFVSEKVDLSSSTINEGESILVHDFKNEEYVTLEDKYNTLGKINEIVIENNIPMTNMEILNLLK